MSTIQRVAPKPTQPAAAKAVTVASLMKAGGKRYESTPKGRQDAYSSVIASKGKLYSVVVGFGRPAMVNPVKTAGAQAALTAVIEAASSKKLPGPPTPAQLKNCQRYDLSVPGRADQSRSLFIDKKTNEMFLHVGAVGWGPNHWSKISPSV